MASITIRPKGFSMSIVSWKSVVDFVAVVSALLAFFAGVGAWATGRIINQRQDAQLRQFDKDHSGIRPDRIKRTRLDHCNRADCF